MIIHIAQTSSFLENVVWKTPFATLYSNSTTSEYEKVLQTLAIRPAVAHPYSFWTTGSRPSAPSFLPEHLRFSEFCFSCPCCNTLCLTGDAAFASLFCIDLSIEGTLKAVTESVRGASSVVDSCSLPPFPAEQLWSEFPCSIHFVGLGFLALQTTSLGRLLTLEVFFSCFGYLNNLTLSHALFVVLIEIPQPTDKELHFSTEAVRLPQACFLIYLIYS